MIDAFYFFNKTGAFSFGKGLDAKNKFREINEIKGSRVAYALDRISPTLIGLWGRNISHSSTARCGAIKHN